jgi:hypothetical protein
MPQKCSICAHLKRSEIDTALLAQQSLRDIARQFHAGKDALFRHKDHISAALAKAKQAQDVGEGTAGSNLLERLGKLNRETATILAEAKASKNLTMALAAIARLERQIEIEGRILGDLNEGAAGGTTFQVVLMDAGREYPDERQAPALQRARAARQDQPVAGKITEVVVRLED